MKYTVTGAHRDSGEELTFTIEAKSRAEAEAAVQDVGMLVTRVQEPDPAAVTPWQEPGVDLRPGIVAAITGVIAIQLVKWLGISDAVYSMM